MKTQLNNPFACLITVVFFSIASVAAATDFYVSSIHPNRNDSNPGTSSTAPWATFDKMKGLWGTTIKAGDTVHLEKGSRWTWAWGSSAPWWVIRQGGSAGAPITIRGDDYGSGAKPLLQRTGGTGWGSMIVIAGAASYVTMRDFAVDGGSDAGFGTTGFTIGAGYLTGNISNIQILNMTMSKLGNSTANYANGVEIVGYNNYSVSDCLIQGNEISGYSGHGINHYPQKTTYRTTSMNNRITVRYNRLLGCSPNTWQGVTGAGIHIALGGSGNLFEYNYIEGSHPIGAILVMNCSNDEKDMIIRYNVIRNAPVSNGILVLYDSGGIPATTVNCDIYGNIIMEAKLAGIAVEMGNQISGTLNIFNNTFYDNRKESISSSNQGGELFVNSQNSGLGLNVRNNIFVQRNVSGNAAPCLTIQSGCTAPISHNNNLYWQDGGTSFNAIHDRGTTYTVANAKNYEATAQNTDPQFTDVSQKPAAILEGSGTDRNGLLPKSTSPAVDRGAALSSAYAKSLNNVTRPQGSGWDIGAYEYTTGTPSVGIPTAPSALSASAVSTGEIRLTWQDNAVNETSFKIERGTNQAGFSQVATVSSNVTLYANTGLATGVTYYYRIRAANAAGDSGYSQAAFATPGEIIVDDMGPNFTTTAGHDAWTVHEDAAGMHYSGYHHYNLQMGTGLDSAKWTFTVPAAGTYDVYAWWWDGATRPPDAPYTVSHAGGSAVVKVDQRTNGGKWNLLGTYSFNSTGFVTMTDAATSGSGLVADAIRLVFRSTSLPPAPVPPSAPSGVTAVAPSVNQVTLAWQDTAANETGFKIERGTNIAAFAQVATVSSNVTTFVSTGLTAGVTYYFRVRASNSAGDSGYSPLASATPGELILDDTGPNFSTTSGQDVWIVHEDAAGMHYGGAHHYNLLVGTGQDAAKWTFSVPAAGTYDVYAWWWDGATRPPDVPCTINYYGGNSTVTLDQRTNGGRWNLLGAFPFSSTGSVTMTDAASAGTGLVADALRIVYRSASLPQVKAPPVAPSVLAAVAVSASQIRMNWVDNAADEAGFKIEQGTNATVFSAIATVSSNVISYAATGLTAGVTYFFRVKSFNSAGDSAYANVASAATPVLLLPPAAPTGFTGASVESNKNALAWHDNAGNEDGFRIERSLNGSAFAVLATVGANITAYTHAGVTLGSTNTYRVLAFNAAGNSAFSPTATIVAGEYIFDDAGPAFGMTTNQDAWVTHLDAVGQNFRGSHHYNLQPGNGGDSARWTFYVPAEAMYDIYAWWWDGATRPPDVPYTVVYLGGGTVTVKVDQRVNGGQWNLLGTFPLGGTNIVSVSDAVSGGIGIVADAIRLVVRPDLSVTRPAPPTGLHVEP